MHNLSAFSPLFFGNNIPPKRTNGKPNTTVVPTVEPTHNTQRAGVTILAFSSYPNGFPVLDLDEKAAKKMAQKALPSVTIEDRRLLFGRTKWQGRTVGAVVYPISEQDVRHVQNILENTQLSDYERNTKVNNFMPTVMAKDSGQTRIYDLQRDKLLTPEEAQELSKVGHVVLNHANRQAEQITSTAGAADTPAVHEKLAENTKRLHLPTGNALANQALAAQAHYQQSYRRFSPTNTHALTTKHPTLSVGVPATFLPLNNTTHTIATGVQPATLPYINTTANYNQSQPIPTPSSTLPQQQPSVGYPLYQQQAAVAAGTEVYPPSTAPELQAFYTSAR
jgi:hypothetical protein